MEEERLKEGKKWKQWGPYLSERQWGTVREDCSLDGNCWDDFTHDQAVYRAYRWGEDGLLGITDDECNLCLALSLWNGKDPILKERLFGLSNPQGNHGEDVKELYYYLDNTPTHSYMKAVYKFPQEEFPYKKLEEENLRRTVNDREYELLDTGIFDSRKYFSVQAEYCKASPTDILGRYTITNHGTEAATIHVLPTLWYRNVWSWGPCDASLEWKPSLCKAGDGKVICQHPKLGFTEPRKMEYLDESRHSSDDEINTPTDQAEPALKRKRKHLVVGTHSGKRRKVETKGAYVFEVDMDQNGVSPTIIFTENETNYEKEDTFIHKNKSTCVKDSFHEFVIKGKNEAVHKTSGTKCAAHYVCTLEPGQSVAFKVRLHHTTDPPSAAIFSDGLFETLFEQRIKEMDEFYNKVSNFPVKAHRQISRNAYGGLLWNKQFYYLRQREWRVRREEIISQRLIPSTETNTEAGAKTFTPINVEWLHLFNKDIISMPDKWEFPWYAAWDLALQCIPLATLDVQFAMSQVELLLQDGYQHLDGRIPAFEFNFSDTNPPIHAYAVLKVFKKSEDIIFLKRCYTKLQANFKWWMENRRIGKRNIFTGGFLGFDNISLFNRSDPPIKKGYYLVQADATAWMALFCLNMLEMSLILAKEETLNQTDELQDMAIGYLKHFLEISEEMNKETGLWNEGDGFFYDHIVNKDRFNSVPLRVKSMVGLVALFGTYVLGKSTIEQCPKLVSYVKKNEDALHISSSCSFLTNGDISLSVVNKAQLSRILCHAFDEEKFLSPFGVRSLSKEYKEHPYVLDEDEWTDCVEFETQESNSVKQPTYRIGYEPGESQSSMFGGNSNWRGPVWMPVNFLLIEGLQTFGNIYGEDMTVEFPTRSGKYMNLDGITKELAGRLIKLFVPDETNQRPCHGGDKIYATNPDFNDLCLFHEYFHGDTGRGCGASHQTGWTALICKLLDLYSKA